jgi:hypothetical protein
MNSLRESAGTNRQGSIHLETDSELVPRGKGEKNPGEGSEIELKPYAYKESERMLASVTACLLKNEPTSLSARRG